MPTMVSYLRTNAYRPKSNSLGEGEVFNVYTDTWEESDVGEKKHFVDSSAGEQLLLASQTTIAPSD